MAKIFDSMLQSVERSLDKFDAAFFGGLNNLCVKLFEYNFNETRDGMFCLFDSPEKIKDAAKATSSRGFTGFDCLTPFPVHGLEFDMGFKRSKVPYITFFCGITGTTLAFLLQFGIHEQISTIPYLNSYPLNIGGKPSFSWPAMIPVCFEMTILFGGWSTFLGMLLLGKMPRPFRKILHPSITDDKFCLWIPSSSAKYNEGEVRRFMQELGGQEITVVHDEKKS